jgi:DeoR/GlpR family transcriptional regulator of sugar metabolism
LAILGYLRGASSGGVTSKHAADATAKRAMLGSALKTVLLADHSKFGQSGAALRRPAKCAAAVVTDCAVDWLRDAGLKRGVGEWAGSKLSV